MSDLIRRQDAIDALDMIGSVDTYADREYAREVFTSLPSAQPGRWIKISPAGIYECSECGKNVMTADIEAYEFCHGCGAKMEVEHD